MNLSASLYNPSEKVLSKIAINREEAQQLLTAKGFLGMDIVVKHYDPMEKFFSNLFPTEVSEVRQRTRHIGSIENLEEKVYDYYTELLDSVVTSARRKPHMSELLMYSAFRSYADMKTMEFRTGFTAQNRPPLFGSFTPVGSRHAA